MMKSSSPRRQPSLKLRYIMVIAGFVLAPLYAAYVVETNDPGVALTVLMATQPLILIPLGMLFQETLTIRKALRNRVDYPNGA